MVVVTDHVGLEGQDMTPGVVESLGVLGAACPHCVNGTPRAHIGCWLRDSCLLICCGVVGFAVKRVGTDGV